MNLGKTIINVSDTTCFKSTPDKSYIARKKSQTMFVRSPKHFKSGKQFVNLYRLRKLKTYYMLNKQFPILLLYNKSSPLYYAILNYLNLDYLPNKNPISIKVTTNIKLSIYGWCFIFKYNN